MPSTKVIKVLYYCSDSEQDEQMRQTLEKYLSILKSQGAIASWERGTIGASKECSSEIDTHIKTADIILLLIGAEFTASHDRWNVVVQQAMEQHKTRKARVIPVFLHPVIDNCQVAFGNLKAFPEGERPVTDCTPYDQAFVSIAKGIQEVVKKLIDSSFPIKKYLRQIKAGAMPFANTVANAFANVTITITFFTRKSSYRRRIRAGLMQLAKPVLIVAGAIFLSPLLPDLSKIFSSEPNKALSSIQNVTPIGWIRIGIINNTSSNLSFVQPLLQSSDDRSAPSIDSPVVPSIGAVVTVKNPVNLRKTRPQEYHNSDLPQKVGLLKPEEKLIILKVQRLINTDFNSFRIEVWAQVGRCKAACDK